MKNMPRRVALNVLQWLAVLTAAWPVAAFLGYRPRRLRAVTFTPEEQRAAPLYKEGVFLLATEDSYMALSGACPHLGCQVQAQTGGGFACPCHGSRFDAAGKRLAGPAKGPMEKLDLETAENGGLRVFVKV